MINQLHTNNTNLNITNMINNENLSELVGDLKQLQHNNSNKNSQHLKANIEMKIRSLVENITKKVLNEQNGNAENVKNDIIKLSK